MSGYGNKGPGPGWGRGPGGMPPHLMGVNNDFGGGGMLQQGIPLQQQGLRFKFDFCWMESLTDKPFMDMRNKY